MINKYNVQLSVPCLYKTYDIFKIDKKVLIWNIEMMKWNLVKKIC